MIGVNVHMRYTDGAYANLTNVLQALKFLGVRHVRDVMPGTGAPADLQARDALRRLVFDGIKLNLVFSSGWRASEAVDLIRALERAVSASVASVEGYNEINNFPVTYEGQSGPAAAAAGQKALYQSIKGSPDLGHVPVIDHVTLVPSACGCSSNPGSSTATMSPHVSVVPLDGAKNIGTNAQIQLRFDAPIDLTSVNDTTVQVTFTRDVDAASVGVSTMTLYVPGVAATLVK